MSGIPKYGKSNSFYKHGMSHHPLHDAWLAMRYRCTNPKHQAWKDYGGRCIGFVPEWAEFAAFRDWAFANGWKPGLTLERKDNNADYSPANCCFATMLQQNRNRRYNKLTYAKVEIIRMATKLGFPRHVLAKWFGVQPKTIYLVVTKRRWK